MAALSGQVSIDSLLQELGRRLEQYRLNRNITQSHLAREAGVSERTVMRIEQGHSVQMANFLKLINVLGLSEHLDVFIPEPIPSPMQQLALQGKGRQRASSMQPRSDNQMEWSWEDDE
ncbi:helix-turn-helix transcriptional regulator [Terasakiella sp.]|uniref:helix-turn-helix transcriptional regulator n=1 Tax=Terasakiella sp. TaxID=2034861 RepID=UPI003AA8C2D2